VVGLGSWRGWSPRDLEAVEVMRRANPVSEIMDDIMSSIAHTVELRVKSLEEEAGRHMAEAEAISDALAHGDIRRLVKFGVVSYRDISDLKRMGVW
jgi:hypothetical protein